MYEPHASHFTLPSGQAAREREREQWRLEHMYDGPMVNTDLAVGPGHSAKSATQLVIWKFLQL